MKSFIQYIKEDSDLSELPEVYLDMDETIVDWMSGANAALKAAGYPEWKDPYWKENHTDAEADKLRWDAVNQTPNFWENLEFTDDGKKIWLFLKKYRPKILSACGVTAKNCKKGKLRWLAKHLGMKHLSDVHLVRRDQKKKFAQTEDGKPTVLIDDYIKNCLEYRTAGGLAIQATTASDVITKLKRLGFR